MKTKLLFIIGLFSTLISCKNDNSETDSIIIGLKSDILVYSYDVILKSELNDPESLDINVNGDNQPDYRFISESWGSTGMGYSYEAKILCLNSNALINGYYSNDTMYVYRYSDTTTYGEQVNIQNISIYSCRKNDEKYSINVTPNQFKINTIDNGEILYKNSTYKSDTITLSLTSTSGAGSYQCINDTCIYNGGSYIDTCLFTSDLIKYIGIKIVENNIEKIGWIKISISNNYIISIFESAIQQ